MTSEERVKLFNQVMSPHVSEDFRNWLYKNSFFCAPASIKYHGNYEGGLFDHSFCVTNVLVELSAKNNLHWQRAASPFIVGMLHDVCKIDKYKESEPDLDSVYKEKVYKPNTETLLKGHGEKSVMILAAHLQLTEEEVVCIRYHMGAFTEKEEWNDYTRAIRRYPNVLWVHHADMIASHVIGI